MSRSRTYTSDAITLKTTKLGETDLILGLLTSEGKNISAVLKGGRNPRSKQVGRASLFMTNRLLLAKGRNLETISDATTLFARKNIAADFDRSVTASFCSELAFKFTQPGNEEPKLYTMCNSLLDLVDTCKPDALVPLALGFAFKSITLAGLRPQSFECTTCGQDKLECLRWSYVRNSAICDECKAQEVLEIGTADFACRQIEFLLKSTLSDIAESKIDKASAKTLLEIVLMLILDGLDIKLKASEYFESLLVSEL